MVTNACQPCRSILVTLPTVTSSTRTREFGSMLSTSGICAWMVNAPGPRPWTPGSGSEFSPCHSPHPDSRERQHDHADRHANPLRPHHGPTPAGTIMPVSPSAGFVATGGPSAASGGPAGAGGGASAGRWCAAAAPLRRNVVGPHPFLAVGDLVRPRRGTDEEVLETERREVVLAVLHDRRQILHAQLRRLLGTQPRRRLHGTAEEGDRVGEVVDRKAWRSPRPGPVDRCSRSSGMCWAPRAGTA